MKTIFADYNAATESGHLRLTFDVSQVAIRNAKLHPGDWAWLSDGEVFGRRSVEDGREVRASRRS